MSSKDDVGKLLEAAGLVSTNPTLPEHWQSVLDRLDAAQPPKQRRFWRAA